jgi:hypothetical protein
MSRVCTICSHPRQNELEKAIVAGAPIRTLARENNVGEAALRRHRDLHLTKALGKAVQDERIEVDAERLTGWMMGLQGKTIRLLARAETEGDLSNARGFIAEARKNVELLGRLRGALDGPTVHVDARRQIAVLGNMDESELRRLIATAEQDVIEGSAVRELEA